MNVRSSFMLGLIICTLCSISIQSLSAVAQESAAKEQSDKERYQEQLLLYEKMNVLTNIPWYWYAAIDQYERTMNRVKKSRKSFNDKLISIYYPSELWAGPANPNPDDSNPRTIGFFGGIGQDGNGDGKSDLNDPEDVLQTLAFHFTKYGISTNDIRLALWDYYRSTRSVTRIEQFARMYASFQTLDLYERAFPVPVRSHYSYRDTWGAARGWGGRRIHEGTDIFANYGTPVRSTCYGIIEVIGWNKFGGWRIGIRDMNNVYHYFAHLSGFNKKIKEGDLVTPGQVIAWVGSSGYGKPGTQGKFPPHLHYGMYRDSGANEWSFDPYPYLRRWERAERKKG